MNVRALPFVLLQGFLFGTTLIASRFSVGQFHPLTYIGLRFLLASFGHLVIYPLVRRPFPREGALWGHAALLGVFGSAVPMIGVVASLQYQSSGVTGVLISLGPALTILLAHLFLPEERLSPRKSLGVALALAGGLLLALRGETGLPDIAQANPLGYGLVIMATLSAAGATIYARRFMRRLDAFDVASVRMFAGTAVVLPLGLAMAGMDLSRVDGMGWLALGYATVAGTFGGLLLGFYVIKRFGATASAMTAYVIPVVASVGGVLALGEQITPGMLVGMALILLGIGLIQQRGPAPDLTEAL